MITGAAGSAHLPGSRFGDPGFYRLLEIDAQRIKVRYMKTLHEEFDGYTDELGVRDHLVRFVGMTIPRLHYRMTAKD